MLVLNSTANGMKPIIDRQTHQVNHILDDNYLILCLKNISNHRVALLSRIKVDFPSCNVYHTSNS